jgi:hypothetical protein
MRIQEGLQNCYQGFTAFLSRAGNWIKTSAQAAGSAIANTAHKVWEWAKPRFRAIGDFLSNQWNRLIAFFKEHKEKVILVAATAGLIAIVYAIGRAFCCGDKKKTEVAKTETKQGTATATATAAATETKAETTTKAEVPAYALRA